MGKRSMWRRKEMIEKKNDRKDQRRAQKRIPGGGGRGRNEEHSAFLVVDENRPWPLGAWFPVLGHCLSPLYHGASRGRQRKCFGRARWRRGPRGSWVAYYRINQIAHTKPTFCERVRIASPVRTWVEPGLTVRVRVGPTLPSSTQMRWQEKKGGLNFGSQMV